MYLRNIQHLGLSDQGQGVHKNVQQTINQISIKYPTSLQSRANQRSKTHPLQPFIPEHWWNLS